MEEKALKNKLLANSQSVDETSDLKLTDIIDIDILQKLQDGFAELNDVASLIVDNEGKPITRPSNFSDFCKIIRTTEKGTQRCEISDASLSRLGYTAIKTESGENAIETYKAQKDQIDLVILDLGMPGMGGHKCLKELLKIDSGIKVIIASGYPKIGKVKETVESGASGFIGKPYQLADMLKKVREALDNIDHGSVDSAHFA